MNYFIKTNRKAGKHEKEPQQTITIPHAQQKGRSEMNLVYLDGAKEPYTTSEIIAECSEVQHHTITRLIRANKADFEALGILGFKIHKLDGRGQPKKVYILNEQQASMGRRNLRAIRAITDQRL